MSEKRIVITRKLMPRLVAIVEEVHRVNVVPKLKMSRFDKKNASSKRPSTSMGLAESDEAVRYGDFLLKQKRIIGAPESNREDNAPSHPLKTSPWHPSLKKRVVYSGFKATEMAPRSKISCLTSRRIVEKGGLGGYTVTQKFYQPRPTPPAFGTSAKRSLKWGDDQESVVECIPGPGQYHSSEFKAVKADNKAIPSFAFGKQLRFPKLPHAEHPGVGQYELRPCWSKGSASAAFRDGVQRDLFSSIPEKSPGPKYYPAKKWFRDRRGRKVAGFETQAKRFSRTPRKNSTSVGPGRYHDGIKLPQCKSTFNTSMINNKDNRYTHFWATKNCQNMA
mmetsp:Transcript_32101/g.56349  ORF Transcript_32101/g.56349 Transcript_32101/m.56349 type:complete len:334 (+) Transcript_32101:141-1142(+)|eukprot:CAMPEP_0197529234 /NCGR_PEP_ID=MMETSP1318-20131121/27692_1 /TAXON_ID=552666 /ORGANISM="Partenskyella glossopodia, Strain RCC365" /LENGTH=333 /DNA_ID=CAMNT_0043084619 /DNA_START=98 /DNA_END=1099 /DNA_ORIENTATION=+